MRKNKVMRLLVIYVFLLGVVSCETNNSELSTEIFLEERIQKAYFDQLGRGDGFKARLRAGKADAKSANNQFKVKKIETLLRIIDKVDKETAILIKQVDDLKMEIIKLSGGNIDAVKNKDNETIIWKKYDPKDPLRPSRLNLSIFDGSGTAPNNLFDKIDSEYSNFRLKICDLIGTYKLHGKNRNVKTTPINKYTDYNHLEKKVNDMLRKQKASPDDLPTITNIYKDLTCRENFLYNNLNGSSNMQALSILSSIQFDILKARASALQLCSWKTVLCSR